MMTGWRRGIDASTITRIFRPTALQLSRHGRLRRRVERKRSAGTHHGHPPFYRTRWFLLLAVLSVAGLSVLFYSARVNQLRRAHATGSLLPPPARLAGGGAQAHSSGVA